MVSWQPYVPAKKPPKPDFSKPVTTAEYNLWQLWQLSETAFQSQVIKLATEQGWMYYHTKWSLHSPRGFPDLVLTHPGFRRTVFIELKRMAGTPSPAQTQWLSALQECGNEVYLFRPDDQSELETVLQPSATFA